MKTPQLEDCFTRVANEILENLSRINLSSYQSRIVYAIFRKTYGYHKKDDYISISQLVEITGIHKAHVSRTKKELLTRRIVTSSGNKIGFQKDVRLWRELPRQVTNKKVTSTGPIVTSSGNKKLPRQADTKDNKDTITKDTSELINQFSKVNHSYKVLYKNKTQRSSCDRLIKQYGTGRLSNLMAHPPAIIQKPYAPTITTPYQLEVKMGELIAFMRK